MLPRRPRAGSGRIGMMMLMMVGCALAIALVLLGGGLRGAAPAGGLGLVWLLVALACPLMMFLMMRPHHNGGEGAAPGSAGSRQHGRREVRP